MKSVTEPELNKVSRRLLIRIQSVISDNELDVGNTMSVGCYEYRWVHISDDPEDSYQTHEDINVKNDKYVRRLIEYLVDCGSISPSAYVELPYYNPNVLLKDQYLYAHSLTFKILELGPIINFGANGGKFSPVEKVKINSDFSIHDGDQVYFQGKLIELQPQIQRIVALIMRRSLHGLYTSREDIIDNCLSEEYLESIGGLGDENRAYNYLRRAISVARSSFKLATGAEKDKDYFPNRSGTGYTFEA